MPLRGKRRTQIDMDRFKEPEVLISLREYEYLKDLEKKSKVKKIKLSSLAKGITVGDTELILENLMSATAVIIDKALRSNRYNPKYGLSGGTLTIELKDVGLGAHITPLNSKEGWVESEPERFTVDLHSLNPE